MFVVFKWWCPYTTGPSPATRICAPPTDGANSRIASPLPVNTCFMNTSQIVILPCLPRSLRRVCFEAGLSRGSRIHGHVHVEGGEHGAVGSDGAEAIDPRSGERH